MAKSDKIKLDKFFAALADRTRLRLINLMRDGEVCVCFFAETLDTNNPKISRHLSYLKRAGLVSARRDGKWSHYSLTPPKDSHLLEMFTVLLQTFEKDTEMRRDRVALDTVCCSPRNPFVVIAKTKRDDQ